MTLPMGERTYHNIGTAIFVERHLRFFLGSATGGFNVVADADAA